MLICSMNDYLEAITPLSQHHLWCCRLSLMHVVNPQQTIPTLSLIMGKFRAGPPKKKMHNRIALEQIRHFTISVVDGRIGKSCKVRNLRHLDLSRCPLLHKSLKPLLQGSDTTWELRMNLRVKNCDVGKFIMIRNVLTESVKRYATQLNGTIYIA